MIPVYEPYLGKEEREHLLAAFDSGWISSTGEFVDLFEAKLAEITKARWVASCSNGTAALHLLLSALGIGPGDEVIIPNVTFVATMNAVLYCGAIPVFCDHEESSWCISAEKVEQLITEKTRAVIHVSLYGEVSELPHLRAFCDKQSLVLIDDSAEGLGSMIDGVPAQAFAHHATLSFYGNKTITTGEGGAVVSSSEEIISRVKALRGHCQTRAGEFLHHDLGYNYRLNNLSCAIGAAQINRLGEIIEAKRKIHEYYFRELGSRDDVEFQQSRCGVSTNICRWLSVIRITGGYLGGQDFTTLRKSCNSIGFDIRPGFTPMSQLPYTKNLVPESGFRGIGSNVINPAVWICLPSAPSLTAEAQGLVIDGIQRLLP